MSGPPGQPRWLWSCGVARLGCLNHDDAGTGMPAKIKTWLIWLTVAFLVFAVVRNPSQAANVVRAIWDLIYMTISGFVTFFGELVS